jgi:prophage antirepressor-like protein
MSSTSTKLEFNGVQIKAFTDKNGTYWFSSAEICSILNTSKQDLDSSEFKVAMLRDDHGQKRAIHLVNERGVYSLIHASTSGQSKKFLGVVGGSMYPIHPQGCSDSPADAVGRAQAGR